MNVPDIDDILTLKARLESAECPEYSEQRNFASRYGIDRMNSP